MAAGSMMPGPCTRSARTSYFHPPHDCFIPCFIAQSYNQKGDRRTDAFERADKWIAFLLIGAWISDCPVLLPPGPVPFTEHRGHHADNNDKDAGNQEDNTGPADAPCFSLMTLSGFFIGGRHFPDNAPELSGSAGLSRHVGDASRWRA